MLGILKRIQRNYIIFLLPIIYSLVIVCYPYPKEFDINWRYVEFYNYVGKQTVNLENVSVILQQSPDFIFQILIILFAKLNIPIKVLFFIITWVTVFNFLFVYKYYSKKFDVKAPIKSYIIVFCTISVAAVFSGVRNIHALSFIAISMLLYREKKFSLMLLSFLYAVGTHFSISVYGLIFLLINLFRLKTSFIIVTILSLFLLVLNVMPISLYESLLSESLFRKVKFYLMGEDIYLSYFKNFQWYSIFFIFIINYSLLMNFLLFFYKDVRDNDKLNKELALAFLACVLFLFYPNIYGRYYMLLVIYITYYVLLFIKQSIFLELYKMQVFFVYVVMLYVFFKPVFY